MWNDREKLVLRNSVSTLSPEERRALIAELQRYDDISPTGIEVLVPATPEQLVRMLANAPPEVKEMLRHLLGCNGNTCSPIQQSNNCYGRRLSKIEEDRKRAQGSDAIDIPTVAGAGGTVTVDIPAYGVSYYLTSFSMDGEMGLATGSLTRVEVEVSHAGIPLQTFRVSQYYKQSCCTTIADAFRVHDLCLGWDSTLQIKVTNNNALAGETFINGVFSYTRGYPDPVKGF